MKLLSIIVLFISCRWAAGDWIHAVLGNIQKQENTELVLKSPPTISVVHRYNNEVSVVKTEDAFVKDMTSAINVGNFVGQDAANTIAQEIYLTQESLSGDHTAAHVVKDWKLTVAIGQSELKVMELRANISKNSVKLQGGVAAITQAVPKLYDRHEHCARTGNRKYGIAGPRTRECSVSYPERGLRQNEIDLIRNVLNAQVQSAYAQLA